MTLHEVSSQIYSLTLGGFVNGEKLTKHQFETVLAKWMRGADRNKIKNAVVIEVCLRDGRWLCEVTRFADRPDGYDYYIPDTREQEQELWNKLTA